MTISDAVAPHLPFLRRFSRALTGTQAGGDSYVVATLETILAEPDCLETGLGPKVALYKLFLRGWRNVPANTHVDSPAFGDEFLGSEKPRGHLRRTAARLPLERIGVLQSEGDRTNTRMLGT